MFKSISERMSKGSNPKLKGKEMMIVLVIVGILLAVLAIPTDKKEEEQEVLKPEEQEETISREEYEQQLEQRLEEILSRMEGVGQVKVMVTLEASSREVIEKDISLQRENTGQSAEFIGDSNMAKDETTVYSESGNGSVPYVVQEIYPEVEGVLVVAEGGDNSYVNIAIVEAIQALFGIDVHKIKIVKMNTNQKGR